MAFPSNYQDLQQRVIEKLRLESPQSLGRVGDWVNEAYAQVCIETEFLRSTATSSLSATNTNVALPAGIIRIVSLQAKPSGGSYGAPMQRVSMDRLLALRAGNATAATPAFYTVTQSTVEFFPTAVGGETLQWWYSKLPTALSAATDTPAIDEPYATRLLEYGALAIAAEIVKDSADAEYKQLYQQWLQRFVQHLELRQGMPIDMERDLQAAKTGR